MLFESWGATEAEKVLPLPGDELINNPYLSATRSISLGCTPLVALAWLAQMGTGRAGWYSYDLIDNFGRPSARHLNRAWQVTTAGDHVPAGPISFRVAHLDDGTDSQNRPGDVTSCDLVLALLDRRLVGHRIDFTLAYRATAADDGQRCRLISRARAHVSGPLSGPANLALAAGDGLMVRRQLLGLADRCR